MTEQQEVSNYQTNHPNQIKAFYFTKQDVLDALNQSGADGIRLWLGQDAKFTMWMHGACGKSDWAPPISSLVVAKTVKSLYPCPDWCS